MIYSPSACFSAHDLHIVRAYIFSVDLFFRALIQTDNDRVVILPEHKQILFNSVLKQIFFKSKVEARIRAVRFIVVHSFHAFAHYYGSLYNNHR